ncbi:MAG: NAD(P)/FAD-dependent oxidoreductase, partial [Bacillota bacterium]
IGVRVELPAEVLEELTSVIFESKFIYYSKTFEDRVRTFCMCPHGEVVMENQDGLITVNGHSHAERKTANTNFALLVSKTFTQPFREPITYGRYVAGLANLLGGGVIVQRLGDLQNGRRSTKERLAKGLVKPTLESATPGDLSLVLPYRHLLALLEMLKALDVIAPGVNSRNTLLYGVEVKFYSSRLSLSSQLETDIHNLYAVGDGAGVTRGLMQASISGVMAARAIIKKYGK